MGRNRKKGFQKLPKYVYVNRERYIFRPPKCKDIVIGKVSSLSIPDVWEFYKQLTGSSTETLDYIIDEYLKGTSYAKLKDEDQRKERKRLLDVLLETNARGRFGSKRYKSITPGTIRKYLDHKGTVAANREVAALSAAWSYCYQRDIITILNPCLGVDRLPEKPRTRLVSEADYMAVYALAPVPYKVAMELAYLCRMRRNEILNTRVKHILEEGLDTRRLKGSRDAITLWSDRLKAAVNLGLKGKIRVPEMPIVTDHGSDIKPNAFSKAFNKLVKRAGVEPFTFHDLKSRGVSSFTGDKLAAGGWKDPKMLNVYDRSKLKVEATE